MHMVSMHVMSMHIVSMHMMSMHVVSMHVMSMHMVSMHVVSMHMMSMVSFFAPLATSSAKRSVAERRRVAVLVSQVQSSLQPP